MDTQLAVHISDSSYCALSWRRLFIVIWRAQPDGQRLAALEKPLLALADKHPDGVGWVVVMDNESPLPNMAVRATAIDLLRRLGKRCLFQVVIFEQKSLVVSLLRATLNTVGIAIGSQRMFLASSVAEAAKRVAAIPGVNVREPEFSAAVEEGRRVLAATEPLAKAVP